MSATATATVVANDAPPPPNAGKKKLLLIIGAAVLALVLVGGGAAVWLLKSRAAADDDADEGEAGQTTHAVAKHDDKRAPPAYLPLDPFTINLADKEGERFAQIAVTLEIEDAHVGDQIKLYLPAIRHNILMTLAHKSSAELLTREGKELLARQILADSLRPMGIDVPDAETAADSHADDAAPKKKGGKPKKTAAPKSYPIRSVQFASFIIQ